MRKLKNLSMLVIATGFAIQQIPAYLPGKRYPAASEIVSDGQGNELGRS
jgi:hypothetical protein